MLLAGERLDISNDFTLPGTFIFIFSTPISLFCFSVECYSVGDAGRTSACAFLEYQIYLIRGESESHEQCMNSLISFLILFLVLCLKVVGHIIILVDKLNYMYLFIYSLMMREYLIKIFSVKV